MSFFHLLYLTLFCAAGYGLGSWLFGYWGWPGGTVGFIVGFGMALLAYEGLARWIHKGGPGDPASAEHE